MNPISTLLAASIAALSLAGCIKKTSAPESPMPQHDPKNEIRYVGMPSKLKKQLPDLPPSRRLQKYESLERKNGPMMPLHEYELEQEALPTQEKDKKPVKSPIAF